MVSQVLAATAGAAQTASQAAAAIERKRAKEDTAKGLAAIANDEALPSFKTRRGSDAMWTAWANNQVAELDPVAYEKETALEDEDAVHHWLNNRGADAPDIAKAIMLTGGRQKWGTHKRNKVQLATRQTLKNLADNHTHALVTPGPVDFNDTFVPWSEAATEAGFSKNEILMSSVRAAKITAAKGDVPRTKLISAWIARVHKRGDLVSGLVDAAVSRFQTDQYNTMKAGFETDILAGRPLNDVFGEMERRTDTPTERRDITPDHQTAMKNYLQSVSQGLAKNRIYGGFRNGTEESETMTLLNAKIDEGVFSHEEALRIQRELATGRHNINRMAKVQKRIAGDETIVLNERDSDAAVGIMLKLELARGQSRNPNGTGNEFWGVPPGKEVETMQFIGALGFVPTQTSRQMGDALESDNRDAVSQTLANYLILKGIAPKLADDVYEKLGKIGKIRAGLSEITPIEAATELSTDPQRRLGQGPDLDTIMTVEPKPYSRNDISKLIINVKEGAATLKPEEIVSAIQVRIRDSLPAHLVKTKGWIWKEKVPKFEVDSVPRYIANTYSEHWEDRFRALASIPNMREDQAASLADVYALNRVTAANPPAAWRERIIWLNGGPEPDQFMENKIESALKQHFSDSRTLLIMATYAPKWDKSLNAYTLHHDTSPISDLEIPRGGLFIWRPKNAPQQTRKHITPKEARRTQADVDATMNNPNIAQVNLLDPASSEDVLDAVTRYGGDRIAAEAYLNTLGLTATYEIPATETSEK